jgi:hypothetical protein
MCTSSGRSARSLFDRTRTDEVNDEAAVGPAAGGAVEEGLAVGRVRHGARRRGVADEVARVDERVAEREEMAVAAAAVVRPCRCRSRRHGHCRRRRHRQEGSRDEQLLQRRHHTGRVDDTIR